MTFKRGNGGWGTFETVIAISDVFLVKSLVMGLGKVATKTAWKTGSHSWGATRKWMVKTGQVEKGHPLHHWGMPNTIGKKYSIQRIVNQPWNLIDFENQALHITQAHGMRYLREPGLGIYGKLRYGNPTWFKVTIASSTGRIIKE